MFDWFKNWYKKAFFEEEEDTNSGRTLPPTRENRGQDSRSFQARMSFQYPSSERGREVQHKIDLYPRTEERYEQDKTNTPTYLRRKDEQLQSTRIETKVENPQNKESKKKSFQPTDVPSPVYGFKKRDQRVDSNEIDETPAYMRKRDQTVGSSYSLSDKTGIEQNNPVEQLESNEKVIPFTNLRRESRIKQQTQSQPQETKPVSKMESIPTDTDHRVIDKANEDKKEDNKSLSNELQYDSNKPKNENSVPFNVLMTPSDKEMHRKSSHVNNILPPIHLLDDIPNKEDLNSHWIEEQMRRLATTLKHFNVRAKVSRAVKGPAVTRFEVQPDMGVKVSKITKLADDIKLNLEAKEIRIEAPIPGKNAIGIEVPNQSRRTVSMLELLKHQTFKSNESKLAVGLGLDIEGQPIIIDLKKMPHGLIAGATGSGKSVCINTILVSLLYKSAPEDVRFLLIDPKMVELTPYNHLPHLVAPVITDAKAATQALKWATQEMDQRYEIFAQEGVRDIDRYNQKVKANQINGEKMPYIVIVIDELADLMLVSPHDVEDAICRIAQKARACGIHLLLATQRPSVDVITGLIKANVPTRIAFSVSSQVDSRTIIDINGAEKLLGKGDMLLIENGVGKPKRIQGAFVSDQEIERVTSYVKKQQSPNYLFDQEDLIQQVSFEEEEDDLLNEAIEMVITEGKASTSLLQRRFSIGYNRAARLIDRMENLGLISQQNGSKPRDVLLDREQVTNLLN